MTPLSRCETAQRLSSQLERLVMFHGGTGTIHKLTKATPTLNAFAKTSHQNCLLLNRKSTLNAFLYTNPSSNALITQARKKVPAHVTGLNVPHPSAHIYTEPGKSSHAMPPRGISKMPATVDTTFADRSAMTARFGIKPNNQRTKKYSTTKPTAIAHHEKRRVSK